MCLFSRKEKKKMKKKIEMEWIKKEIDVADGRRRGPKHTRAKCALGHLPFQMHTTQSTKHKQTNEYQLAAFEHSVSQLVSINNK